ncbi:phosphatase PAP2 family protein [Candidatus Daviesbacteria bacterium]|nr:phosphatase PAP2 family protein [Candidatus Daviesbacteria bacterium]
MEKIASKTVLIMLTSFFIILTISAKIYPFLPFDPEISRFLQQFHPVWFDSFMRIVSYIGDGGIRAVSIIGAFLAFFLIGRQREAIFIFISGTGSILLSLIVKFFVLRPRPDLLTGQNSYFDPSFSYPSGHALFVVGFYGFLLFLTITNTSFRKTLPGKLLIVLFSMLIVLIGVSRIYLGMHWFSDVLGSYLLGSIWLFVITRLYRNLKLG